MRTGCLRHARPAQGKGSKGGMESSGAPLMSPSGCGHRGFNEDVCEAREYCAPGVLF